MAGPESKFWNYIKPFVQKTGIWSRVESPISGGYPDVTCLIQERTLFVELKNKDSWCEGLGSSVIQRRWHHRWNSLGGLSFLLARVDKSIVLVHGSMIDDGKGEEHWRKLACYQTMVGQFNAQEMADLMAGWGR